MHHVLKGIAASSIFAAVVFLSAAPTAEGQIKTAPSASAGQTKTKPATSVAAETPKPVQSAVTAARHVIPQSAAFAPPALNFGDMFSGESRSLEVKILPSSESAAGEATVSLEGLAPALGASAKPVFKIAQVQVWGYSTLGNGAPVSLQGAQQHLLESATHAPFKLKVKPGDYLIVKVDAAPVLDLFSGPSAGNYSAHILASGPAWTANIPVVESFQGLRLGVIATLDTVEQSIYKPEPYTMNHDYPVPVRLTLINSEKTLQHIRINAMTLPTGFSLPSQQVVIPPGQTSKVSLPFTVRWGSGAAGEGPGQRAQLEVAYDAGKKVLPFSFNARPSSKHFSYGSKEGLTWHADYTIHVDGTFEFSYTVTNDSLVVNRNYEFVGTWNGNRVINLTGTVKRHSDFSGHYGFKMGAIEQNYDLMLQTPPVVKLNYKDTM